MSAYFGIIELAHEPYHCRMRERNTGKIDISDFRHPESTRMPVMSTAKHNNKAVFVGIARTRRIRSLENDSLLLADMSLRSGVMVVLLVVCKTHEESRLGMILDA